MALRGCMHKVCEPVYLLKLLGNLMWCETLPNMNGEQEKYYYTLQGNADPICKDDREQQQQDCL
jgi:hypothetical protein